MTKPKQKKIRKLKQAGFQDLSPFPQLYAVIVLQDFLN